MYIGLVDGDLSTRKCYPNLELMKMAAYYKKQKDIVELIRDYRQSERYSKIIFRQNNISAPLPSLYLSKIRNKCDYGGYAFTNGIYIPMEKSIEESLPDVTIYDKILLEKPKYKKWLNKELIRLQTQKDTDFRYKRCLIYDKQSYKFENFKELLRDSKSIEFIEPQYIDNVDLLGELATSSKVMTNSILVSSKELSEEELIEFGKMPLRSRIYYPLFPEKYANVTANVGCSLILSKMDQIKKNLERNNKLKPYCIFKNRELRIIMTDLYTAVNNPLSQPYLIKMAKENGQKYLMLLKQIKELRRYK